MKSLVQPLYTLEQLAEVTGLSTDSWRRVATNYPGYFIKLAGKTVIRAASLDELLQLHEGGELATRSMSQKTKDELLLRRQRLAQSGPGR